MKKKILLAIALTLSALVSLASCGAKSDHMENSASDSVSGYSVPESPSENMVYEESYEYKAEIGYDISGGVLAEEALEDVAETVTASQTKNDTASQRKIIYNSHYNISTKEYEKSVRALEDMCEKYGAYFESANTYGGYEGSERNSSYTVRVPIENYKSFTGEAGTIGIITSSGQNNSDVTERYYDTEARLESAKVREERVLVILESASKLDDVLALERELADIRYEIESMTGSLRKLDSLVNYATVDITISEVRGEVVPRNDVLTFGERVSKAFNSGIEDFKDFAEDVIVFFAYSFIGIIIWLAVTVVFVVAVILIVRKLIKIYRKKK